MLSKPTSYKLYRVMAFNFAIFALALMMSASAFAAGNSRHAFIDSTTELFGLQSNIAPIFSQKSEAIKVTLSPRNSPLAGVTVSLPTISATPGPISIPITAGDTTGQNILSYDLNIDFNPLIVAPAGGLTCAANACFTSAGTLSSTLTVIPNANFAGHFIIAAFGIQTISGSGTLIILNFNVIGAPGAFTPFAFTDYTDPNMQFHPAFSWNEGDPLPKITNGSITVPGGPTFTPTVGVTNTSTNTPTPTATATFTPSLTATNTPANTSTNTPTRTNTATPSATQTFTPTPTITATSTPTRTNTSTPTATSTFTPSNTATNTPSNTATATATVAFTPTNTATATSTATASGTPPSGVTVSLPNVSASPGSVSIPITAGDTTGQSILSYDLNVDYDPAILQPAGGLACAANACFTNTGTLSSSMTIIPNATNNGHFIIAAFGIQPISGAGTLLILNFTVVGTPGQTTPLTFADYTDPSMQFHPGFAWNEGTPAAIITNGSLTVAGNTPTFTPTVAPTFTFTPTPSGTNTLTPTRTNTSTPTVTNTSTPTGTATATFTPTFTPSNTPTRTSTNTATNTSTATATATSTPTAPTNTPTRTSTLTPTNTATSTNTATATATATATPTGSPAVAELLLVDLTVTNQITITATTGVSAATRSGSTTTGFYFQNMFANAGAFTFTTPTLVSGNLTAASVPTDNSPALFRAASTTEPGLNCWSYSATATTTFTAGQLAFTGTGTWTTNAATYTALLTSPATGNIYFPADDVADVGTATLLGTYRRVGGTPTQTSTATATATGTPSFTPTFTSTPTRTSTNTPTNTGTPTATFTSTPTRTSTNTPTSTATFTSTPTATFTATPSGTPPSIQFSSATYVEDESQTAVITITRSFNTSGTNSVSFSTTNGTATGGAACGTGVDYVTVTNQTVTFNPGATSQTVNVTICGDSVTEPDQTVNLSLTGPNLGTPSAAILTINDTASVFKNGTNIVINPGQAAAPYPSNITVAGAPTTLGSMRVTLYDFASTGADSVDFLLVGPGGQRFILMANAGGTAAHGPATLNFTDTAGAIVPDNGPISTGDFEPTSFGTVANFPAPAPAGPYNLPGGAVGGSGTQTLFGNFGGSNANGVWALYVRDDTASSGNVTGGWGIEFLISTAAQASIAGRVVTADGQGIRNARVIVTGNSLATPLVVTTGSFGYYAIDGLATGETYVVTVNSQRYTFSTPSQVLSLVDNVVDIDFIADPQE